MELGNTDPMMGDKKTFLFYPLLAVSPQNLSWLDHNFKHGGEKTWFILFWSFEISDNILRNQK